MAKPKKPKGKKPKKIKKSKSKAKPKGKKRKKSKPKRPHKPIFERRSADDDSPPEFTITPGAVTQEEAFATIEARLKDAQDALPDGLVGRVILHPYHDGSVDGELYVTVPEGESSVDTEWSLTEAFGHVTVGQKYWISVGARYIVEDDDVIYRRYRGMNQVQTNYQRAVGANIAEEDLILRTKVLRGMKKRYKREAHSIFIRLHWNPQNEQPKR